MPERKKSTKAKIPKVKSSKVKPVKQSLSKTVPKKVTKPKKQLRASHHQKRPAKSKLREIEKLDLLTEPVTLEITSDGPLVHIENPDTVVAVKDIPESIKKVIIENYGDKFLHEKEWTLKTLKSLHKAVMFPRENVTNTLAQICGPLCSYKDMCPHDIVGKAPIGERCPQERALIKLLYGEYMDAVAERLGADAGDLKSDIISHNLVMGLVEADIVSMRLDGTVALDGFISKVPTVVNENTGEVYYKDEESVAVRIKERVYRRRDQIYRQLLATPEMAEKYKRKGSHDVLARTAALVDKLEALIGKDKIEHVIPTEVFDGDE